MEFFELKTVANFGQRSSDDPVTAFCGTGSKLLFGTEKGKLIRCRMENDQLVYDKSVLLTQPNRIRQLAYVNGHDLLLAVISDSVHHFIESSLTDPDCQLNPTLQSLASTGAGSVVWLAVCREQPDPLAVQFAVATNRKSIFVCTRRGRDADCDVQVVERLALQDQASRMAYGAGAVCYSCAGTYFVLRLDGADRSHRRLLDTTAPPHIINVGEDEFCITADDGLLVFVNSSGVANRPPISTKADVVGLEYVEPLLYVIAPNRLLVFNLLDENFKTSLPAENLAHISHVNDDVFLVTTTKVVYKLCLTNVEEQIEKELSVSLENGLKLLDEAKSSMAHNERIQKFCHETLEKTALHLLQQGQVERGLALFAQSNASPTVFLSQIPELNTKPAQEMIISPLAVDRAQLLHFLNDFLHGTDDEQQSKDVKSFAFRLELLMDRINPDNLTQDLLFDDELREWIMENGFHSLAAEICFESGLLSDGLEIWREYAENHDNVDFSHLVFRLGTMTKNRDLVQSALRWLAHKSPEDAMEVIQQIPNLNFDWILDNFNTNPRFVLDYFNNQLDQGALSNKTLEKVLAVYIDLVESDPLDAKTRRELRTLAVSAPFFPAIDQKLQEKSNLNVERVLYSTKLENVDSCIKALLDEQDLDLAESLYLKFADQKPELITHIVHAYERDERFKEPSSQARLAALFHHTRPFNGIEQLLQSPVFKTTPNRGAETTEVSSEWHTNDDAINNEGALELAERAVAARASRLRHLRLQDALDAAALRLSQRRCAAAQRRASWARPDDRCARCRQPVAHENIVFAANGKPAHSRCVPRP